MHLTRCERIRVVRRADGYYAQFCINVERKEEPIPTGIAMGIDVGLNHFYTDSDGETVANPRYLRKSEKALKRLQKRISRKKKGSSNWLKLQNKIARVHQRINDTRKDWHFKLAHHLCDSAGAVFVEDINFIIEVLNLALHTNSSQYNPSCSAL